MSSSPPHVEGFHSKKNSTGNQSICTITSAIKYKDFPFSKCSKYFTSNEVSNIKVIKLERMANYISFIHALWHHLTAVVANWFYLGSEWPWRKLKFRLLKCNTVVFCDCCASQISNQVWPLTTNAKSTITQSNNHPWNNIQLEGQNSNWEE